MRHVKLANTSLNFKVVYCHLYSLHYCFVLHFVAYVIHRQSNEALAQKCSIHS